MDDLEPVLTHFYNLGFGSFSVSDIKIMVPTSCGSTFYFRVLVLKISLRGKTNTFLVLLSI